MFKNNVGFPLWCFTLLHCTLLPVVIWYHITSYYVTSFLDVACYIILLSNITSLSSVQTEHKSVVVWQVTVCINILFILSSSFLHPSFSSFLSPLLHSVPSSVASFTTLFLYFLPSFLPSPPFLFLNWQFSFSLHDINFPILDYDRLDCTRTIMFAPYLI